MRLLVSLALVTTACAAAPKPTTPHASPPVVTTAPTVTPPATPVVVATTVLTTGPHRSAMTEVILDPDGQAAISLDSDGGARLWSDVRTLDTTAPVVLPFAEPAWVSFARAGKGFVVAAVDTAGGARVGHLERNTAEPRWQPLFDHPPTDPLLELHVLGGGERLLALGLDHRLRLLDRTGRVVNVLDAPGFIPWQLRMAHRAGRPPAIVAVLADPVRVQPIALQGDALTLAGEARRVVLDQGPNPNDLALSPDGTFVTALRRPRSKGKVWNLERIDLATGERTYLAGEVDTIVRPRVHLVDGARVLLESGSGKGHWIDLGAAKIPGPGEIVERSKLPLTPAVAIVDLPGSTEDTRMHSTTAAGLRAVVVADAMIADPLADATHLRFAPKPFAPTRVAVDDTRVVWVAGGRLLAETLGDPSPPRDLGAVGGSAFDVFVDREQVLLVISPNEVSLRRWSDGTVVDTAHTRESWGLRAAAYHASTDGHARIAVVGRSPVEFAVDAAGLGELHPLTDTQAWPELRALVTRPRARLTAAIRKHTGDDVEADVTAAAQDREYLYPLNRIRRLYQIRGDSVQAFEHFRGSNEQLVPSPATPRVAVVDHSVIHARTRMIDPLREPDPVATLTVVDFGGDTPRALWSRSFRADGLDLAWSADGATLAVAGAGGHVFDATAGTALATRTDLGITASREPDATPAP